MLLAVLGYSLVYALAFIQLYFQEHPYRVASYWIYDNVPPGSRIVGPHWDDKVPVGVAGKNPSLFSAEGVENDLPFYERDTPQIIDLLVRRISKADYIMFPTPRTPDSIPRIPNEYPNTTALLRLLWGEKLGFSLVKTFKNRPSFLGLTFNDDLADESFSVYDHPKVVIFQNVEKLPAAEISRRIKEVERYEPLPSMNEMLLMDAGGWKPTKKLWSPTMTKQVGVVGILLVVALSVWVLVGGALRWLPDGGLGLCVGLGMVLVFGVAWLSALFGLIPLTHNGGLAVIAATVLLAFARFSVRSEVRRNFFERAEAHGVYVMLSVLFGALVSVIIRTSDPGFFGIGEEVDATYLSYLARNDEPYPSDVFGAGRLPLKLADRFLLGWMLKVMAVDTATAIKVVSTLVGAMVGGVLYSLVALLVRRPRVALLASLVALIPTTYVLHAFRDSSNRALVAQQHEYLAQNDQDRELAAWVRRTISGTPCFVSACDGGQQVAVAARVGLPLCEGQRQGLRGSQQSGQSPQVTICGLVEADEVFRRMMELGVELFITPSEGVASTEEGRRRYEHFIQRPELFSKIFDNGALAVFVPAFSRHFPRAKDPVSS